MLKLVFQLLAVLMATMLLWSFIMLSPGTLSTNSWVQQMRLQYMMWNAGRVLFTTEWRSITAESGEWYTTSTDDMWGNADSLHGTGSF